MAKFEYTLPSGDIYTVVGPNDATQAQADYVFYTQIAAGSLIGYQSGQTLSGTSINTRTSSMSRLERGTAGVASQSLLAVNTRADILSSVLTSIAADQSGRLPTTIQTLLDDLSPVALAEPATDPTLSDATITSILQHLPVVAAMPPLTNVPIDNPISQADVIQARGNGLGPSGIGPLSDFQVQSLIAQAANNTNQPYNQISTEKGIGKFGFTCYQLEKVGYVKPTTQSRFIDPNPEQFESVMRSPTIWTGKEDINSIDQILENEDLQNQIQQELMQCGYFGLEASGLISQTPSQIAKKMQGYVYSNSGLTGAGLQSLQTTGLLGGQQTATGALLTDFTTTNSLSNTLNLQNYYYNQAKTALTTRANGDVGALISNAAKYGPETTAIWATTGGSNNFARMMVAGKLSSYTTTNALNTFSASTKIGLASISANPITSVSFTNSATGLGNFGAQGITSIPSSVTAQLTNQMTQLSSSMDVLGKAGQFATGFGDIGKNFGDLTSLNKLGDLANGGLDKIGGLATSQLNSLKGLADGALNSISGGIDKLAKIDLGSIADVGKLSGLVDKAGGLGSLLSKGGDLTKMFGGNNALVSGVKIAAGYTDTINRATVDAAVDRIIGSAKINPPDFASGMDGILKDVSSAKEALGGLSQQATAISSNAKEVLSQNGVTGFFG